MSGKAQVYLTGRRLTGMTFGKRGAPVYARIYDKTREADPDALIRQHWADNLGRPVADDEQVWRVEFELHGEFLRDVAVGDTHLLDGGARAFLATGLDAVWQHLTSKWLVLKVPGSATRVSRAKPQAWWSAMSSSGGLGGGPPAVPLVRRPRRDPDPIPLLAQLDGVLASYAARRGTADLDIALDELGDYMRANDGHARFTERVERARLRLPLQARTREAAEASAVRRDDPPTVDDITLMPVTLWGDPSSEQDAGHAVRSSEAA